MTSGSPNEGAITNWIDPFLDSLDEGERTVVQAWLPLAARDIAAAAGICVPGEDAISLLNSSHLKDWPLACFESPTTPLSDAAKKRGAWNRFRRFVAARQVEGGATVIDAISAFYGEPLEGVEPGRLILPREQWDELAARVRAHYQGWTSGALELVRGNNDEPLPFPILSQRPSVAWLGRPLPLLPMAASFTLYMPRFVFVDPLEALARDWWVQNWDVLKHRDSLFDPDYWPALRKYIAQSLMLLQDLAPLVRRREVSFIHQSVRMTGDAYEAFNRMAGPMYDGIPADVNPEHLINVMSWDYAAADLHLSGVAGDRGAWDTLTAATTSLVHDPPDTLSARRVAVLQRTEVPQFRASSLADMVRLRDSVDVMVDLRSVVGSFTAEIETLLRAEHEVSPSLAAEIANERLGPAAAAVNREVRRSNALESLTAGSIVVAGGLIEFMATGKADLASVLSGAGAGVAPWLVWRTQSRLGTGLRDRRRLRDFLMRMAAD